MMMAINGMVKMKSVLSVKKSTESAETKPIHHRVFAEGINSIKSECRFSAKKPCPQRQQWKPAMPWQKC